MKPSLRRYAIVPLLVALSALPAVARAEEGTAAQRPFWLADRGTGIPTSQFGIYARRGNGS